MPKQDWEDYLEMRIKLKKPASIPTKERLVAKLSDFWKDGHDPTKILQQSTDNYWTDIYQIKENHNVKQYYRNPTKHERMQAAVKIYHDAAGITAEIERERQSPTIEHGNIVLPRVK